jgi:succinate dehydrogenase / fumarate reductase cytochrome b subunit
MKWGHYFTSAIGKKLVMAFTGIFLILFLIVHCSANACIFVPDHGATFNKVSHFLGNNWILHILEVGLFVGFILHIVQGLVLTAQNRSKRSVAYAVTRRNEVSTWYSRSMGLLGVLILIFLIIHLAHFWVHTRFAAVFGGIQETTYGDKEVVDLYGRMREVFSQGWVVIVYLAALVALGWHLAHGFQSAFRTLGMNSSKYIPIVRALGFGFAIIVPVIFALMPIAMYFGWVN